MLETSEMNIQNESMCMNRDRKKRVGFMNYLMKKRQIPEEIEERRSGRKKSTWSAHSNFLLESVWY